MQDAARSPENSILRSRWTWAFVACLALYLGLFSFNSLTRTRAFTPDSMNYIDVARNVASGRGLVQSTLGYNQLDFSKALEQSPPVPFIVQGPLYPLLVAALTRVGLAAEDAALLLPVVCYAIILALAFRLAREVYDLPSALVGTAFLLVQAPLTRIARTAWSEALAVGLLFVALWCLMRLLRSRSPAALALAAGVATGLALSARYALFPLVAVGVLFLLLERRRIVGLFVAGAVAASAPAVLRVFGAWRRGDFGHDASDTTLVGNMVYVITELTGRVVDLFPSGLETALVSLALLTGIVFLLRRADLRRAFHDVFLVKGGRLFFLWTLFYLGVLIAERSVVRLDRLDTRLVSPAAAPLALLAAALFVRAFGLKTRGAALLLGAALLAVTAREARTAFVSPRVDEADRIAASERLRWIAENLAESDLVIGEDAVDIPFYFRRTAVSFSPYPRHHPGYERLVAFVDRESRPGRVYLILRAHNETEAEQLERYGPFITDLRAGRLERYPRVRPVAKLSDGEVFEVMQAGE